MSRATYTASYADLDPVAALIIRERQAQIERNLELERLKVLVKRKPSRILDGLSKHWIKEEGSI